MTEDLERLVQAAEGQAPSAEFVARLRAQILAETEGSDADGAQPSGSVPEAVAAADDDITVGADLELLPVDEVATRQVAKVRRLGLLGAAAAVIVVGVWAFSVDNQPDSELGTTGSPTTSTTPAPDAEPLTAGNTFFDDGTFRIDTLGTAFTFSVDETTGLRVNENGLVILTDLTSRNADDRTITLRRTGLLPDPANPTASVDPAGGWPATDLDGWLEAVGDEVVAGDPIDTMLGGFVARFVELEVPCTESRCTAADPLGQADLAMFTPGSRYRLWVVDQGSEDPIVVTVAIDDDAEAAWFDDADAVLETVEFEAIEPNPVRRAPPGSATLELFDGISVELTEEIVIVEPFDGFARVLPPDSVGDVELITRPLDIEGVEVTTTDRLLQLLADEAVEVTELDAPEIGGLEARTFEVSSSHNNIILKTRAADLVRLEFGWYPPQAGQLWLVEHPESGLLLVSAEVSFDRENLEPLLTWTEDLLESLRFEEG